MSKVKLGIIGIGNMGTSHIKNIMEGKTPEVELAAVCDIDPERLKAGVELSGGAAKGFAAFDELAESGTVDAVLIATPHYFHPPMAQKAFSCGLHVLTEKPAGVYTKAVRQMNEAAAKSGRVFGIMYNQRTNPVYAAVKRMMEDGTLGELQRVSWIITDWYRTQSYYDSGTWRATWAGEGGGVLLNQDPHNLDLLQWICGMPSRITGFCSIGKYHDIEVEDDVTAYLEYPNGATGTFITSTGDYPGTNRLEISCQNGKVVTDGNKLTFYKNHMPVHEHLITAKGGFDTPGCDVEEIDVQGDNPQHVGILNNFAAAVLRGEKLLAPGEEGIRGLTISNGIHLSAWTGKAVDLPLDEDLFYSLLQEKIKTSTYQKKEATGVVASLDGTYGVK